MGSNLDRPVFLAPTSTARTSTVRLSMSTSAQRSASSSPKRHAVSSAANDQPLEPNAGHSKQRLLFSREQATALLRHFRPLERAFVCNRRFGDVAFARRPAKRGFQNLHVLIACRRGEPDEGSKEHLDR
jgi:hypothetical protein